MKFIGNFKKWRQRASGWNSIAQEWDISIKDKNHFVNFEDGYRKFERFETAILKKIGKLDSGIDIASGTGAASTQLARHVKNLYLLDIADHMLKIAKAKYPKAKMLHASATEIPLLDKSINIAVSRGILISLLAHKQEIKKLLAEVYRILKPGGIVIFDFLSNTTTAKFKVRESYKKAFTKLEIEKLLTNNGFYKIKFDGDESARVIRVCAKKE
ncbi:MAG: class I SAM-dependent methyltransferase [Candidatus Marsarchaeota archaeon]|jgi:ubiquinone/menaquinone biosynthesis C-methylase UbiE|nr:class I SAM-dependent methyltransferase [Candidatus Marsarchaeota archaeon]MCL5111657.1 class I SAM-dependent methyltransferase [Candidatus Marsarchaeota archaeon]